MIRKLGIIVLLIGVVSVVIGAVFISQAIEKNNWITSAMQQEKVTLGLSEEQIAAGDVIDNAKEAQIAGDTIREHRRGIAPTYNDLLAASGGKFDPTNPEDLDYAQALNMENYLYLAVLSFGVIQMIMGTGAILILIGVALGGIGIALYRLANT